MDQLDIVIPVYNEGATIYKVYNHLEAALANKITWRAFVIYDYAEDSTVTHLQDLQTKDPRIIPMQQNFGKGVVNALKFGFKQVHDEAVVVIMGDDSDDLENLPKMYQKFVEGATIVASSRYSKGGKYLGGNFVKKSFSCLAGWFLNHMGIDTKDPTNNFKLYSGKFLRAVTIESTGGFEIALELTVKAALMGLKITEIPGVWQERQEGKSKFKILKWLPKYLYWFFYYLINKLKVKN